MSLLDGPETVIVYPMTTHKNRYGNNDYVRGPGITVKGVSVEPYGSQSYRGLESKDGESVNDKILIRAGVDTLADQGFTDWPGGSHSIIAWRGSEFDQEGLAKSFLRGSATKHHKIRANRRSAAVK